MASDVYKLIEIIRPRPAMYLGEPSVSLLRAFLDGYILATSESEMPRACENPPFGAFHDWVALKLGYYESTSGWNKMLLKAENGDEEKALERFFIYLDEFKERRAKVILWAVPDAASTWRYQIVADKTIKLPSPTLVQIIKYTDDNGVFVRYLGENSELVDREEYHPDLDVAFSRTEWFIGRGVWQSPKT